MAVQLARLLEGVQDQEIEVLAGAAGLQNPIRWVHMVEGLEISSFLEGGEMAFVTGIALSEECTLEMLIRGIQERGAGGALVNVGPYITEIPKAVIAFCNETNFPLLMVPWHIHMAIIMKHFSEEILRSDWAQTEWTAALRSAVFHSEREELYYAAFDSRGLHIEWSYCVALLAPMIEDDQDASAIVHRCLQLVENRVTMRYPEVQFAELSGQIVLLFANQSIERITEIVQDLLDTCHRRQDAEMYAGIGRTTASARCIAASYQLARKVLQLQMRRGAAWQPVAYNELGVYRLLMAIGDQELLHEYAVSTLGPVIDYDKANGTDYVGFLTTWLDCECSPQRTAERLFLHRNTVDYHLRRISSLLDGDLSRLDTRVQLDLAIKLLELR